MSICMLGLLITNQGLRTVCGKYLIMMVMMMIVMHVWNKDRKVLGYLILIYI